MLQSRCSAIFMKWQGCAMYCTITTLGSQGVMHDGCEQYQTKFISKNFAWWDLNRFIFVPQMGQWAQSRPGKTSDLIYMEFTAGCDMLQNPSDVQFTANCDAWLNLRSEALMDTISNMRWQFENKATGKLLGTIVPTLSRTHWCQAHRTQNHLPNKENVM